MFTVILDFIFPKNCLSCGKSGGYFCRCCIEKIVQGELICPFCSKPSLGGITHPVCRRRYGLDGLWSLGLYKDPLRKAIQKLKYRWIIELADNLTAIIIEYWVRRSPFLLEKIIRDGGTDWVVVPVPLYWKRQNWRGFNQSALLAQQFAKKVGLEYCEALVRVKDTKPQVRLQAPDRKRNVRDAFLLKPDSKLKTKVILVDDVWTTGSTLKECSFVLKKNGVKQIWALTLAR